MWGLPHSELCLGTCLTLTVPLSRDRLAQGLRACSELVIDLSCSVRHTVPEALTNCISAQTQFGLSQNPWHESKTQRIPNLFFAITPGANFLQLPNESPE